MTDFILVLEKITLLLGSIFILYLATLLPLLVIKLIKQGWIHWSPGYIVYRKTSPVLFWSGALDVPDRGLDFRAIRDESAGKNPGDFAGVLCRGVCGRSSALAQISFRAAEAAIRSGF